MLSCFSHVRLFATLWTIACQASLSIGFSRQEYWSGLPWPPPGDLPDPGIEPASPASPAFQVDSLPLSHQGSPMYLYVTVKSFKQCRSSIMKHVVVLPECCSVIKSSSGVSLVGSVASWCRTCDVWDHLLPFRFSSLAFYFSASGPQMRHLRVTFSAFGLFFFLPYCIE